MKEGSDNIPPGRYREIRSEDVEVTSILLGEGAMSKVQLGYYLRKKVAIKYLQHKEEQPLPEADKKGEARGVFLNEYELHSKLDFPTIARVHGLIGRDTACPAIVMELMEESLFARCKRSPELREHEICSIFSDVASALDYMHSLNVIHRDISPKNILLSTVNGYLVAKITDYHNSKATLEGGLREHSNSLHRSGQFKYMAQEMYDNLPYDESVDMYAFGVVLMELLLLPEYISIFPSKRTEEAGKLQEKFKADHPFLSLVNLCITENPSDRPAARVVAVKLSELQEVSKDFKPPIPPKEFCTVGVLTDASNVKSGECLDCPKWKKTIEVRVPFSCLSLGLRLRRIFLNFLFIFVLLVLLLLPHMTCVLDVVTS